MNWKGGNLDTTSGPQFMAENPRGSTTKGEGSNTRRLPPGVLVRRTTSSQPLRPKDFNGFEGVPAFFKESETPSTFCAITAGGGLR